MSISTIMFLIAGLGAFLIGFKILSENIAKLANKTMRNMFNKISGNKLAGVAVGAGTTALIQSSAATTVMLIGFVNAGLITLYQAVPIIMGANIGTTITAIILSLDAIDVPLYAMSLALVGIFCSMLVKKEKSKTFCLAIAGIGLVFFGLKTMSTHMSVVAEQPSIKELLSSVTFPLLLLLLGAVFTIVMQSSTAVTGILLSMAGTGMVIGNGGNCIYYVILGTNIGTCLTAIISSIGASTNAKRTAVIHLLFNVIGSLIFLVILWCWSGFNDFWSKLLISPKMQIAVFHMSFNIICTIIFLPATKLFVKAAQALVPEKKNKSKRATLLDERLLSAHGVAINAVIAETKNMAQIAMDSMETAFEGFMNKDETCIHVVQENLKIENEMTADITAYLVKLSASNISMSSEKIVSVVHTSLQDIERLAELSDNISKYTKTYTDRNLVFSDKVLTEIREMFDMIKLLYEQAIQAMDLKSNFDIREAEKLETKIDNYKKELLDGHMKRLNEGTCKPESSGVFINLVNNLERAGDHLVFMANAYSSLN